MVVARFAGRTAGVAFLAHHLIRYQPPGDTVQVGTWLSDDEFPVHPKGSQPKRTLTCPSEGAPGYLIPGHTYIFKRAKASWQVHQLWSEVIAYRIGMQAGLKMPACFVAVDDERAEVGVLMESFLGEPDQDDRLRLIHGSDIMERFIVDKKKGRPHGVRTNIQVCNKWSIRGAIEWWAKVLAFDAIIGNTDRHPENWGLLLRINKSRAFSYGMAPIFDNATSLGYEINETKIPNLLKRSSLTKYVERGRHHCGWSSQEDGPTSHMTLCGRFARVYPEAVPAMLNVIRLPQSVAAEITQECTCFEVDVPFSTQRAELVSTLVECRKDQLSAVLGG